MITWVTCVAIREIALPVPAGTIAALAVMAPVGALSVEEPGCGNPVGHALRKPSVDGGITVIFSAYACALEGIPQALDCNGNDRSTPAASAGPAKVPVPLRVSVMRQGV